MRKLLIAVMLAALLALSGSCGITQERIAIPPAETSAPTVTSSAEPAAVTSAPEHEPTPDEREPLDTPTPEPELTPDKREPLDSPTPETPPVPEQPAETILTCILWIRCDTILDNLDNLAEEKAELVPEDGVLLEAAALSFEAGESVFDLLLRVTMQEKIHLEFVDTPFYGSAYIEGIGNLYEFDCGERSGWSYKVNGVFPGYGCSLYNLADGDVVEWVYTCDLGRDVGGSNGWEEGT